MAYSHISIKALAFFALIAVAFAVPFQPTGPRDLQFVTRQFSDAVADDSLEILEGSTPTLESEEPEASPSSEPVMSPMPTVSMSPSMPGPSDDVEPSPEDECVDITHLTAYPSHALVHEEHITADVFCPRDSSLPCATANHMLRVEGKSVSYREYCEVVSCDKKTMKVNSVFSHMWEEQTHNNGVVLTMFDGRHPETVQKALHQLMAAGRSVANRFR